jgi:hypothetical protein
VGEELDLKRKMHICRRGVKNKRVGFPYLYLSKSQFLIFLLFRVLDITRLVRLDEVKELCMLILLSFHELMYFMPVLVPEFSRVNLRIENNLLKKKAYIIWYLCTSSVQWIYINKLTYKLTELIRISKYLEL